MKHILIAVLTLIVVSGCVSTHPGSKVLRDSKSYKTIYINQGLNVPFIYKVRKGE